MADVKWIKLTTDMFDNRKIRYLRKLPDGNNIVLIWIMLLTLAGRCNSGGMIFLTENVPYTSKMLADELGFDQNQVQLALEAMAHLGMIISDEDRLLITGWEEHQNVDGMEKIREQTKKRVSEYRSRQKQLQLEERNATCNVTVTQSNATDIDIEEEQEIERESISSTSPKGAVGRGEILKIMDAWNSLGLAQVDRVSPGTTRATLLKARIRDYGVDRILETIEKVRSSSFLNGGGGKGWVATFDWFLKPGNFQKTLEGNYDDSRGGKANMMQSRGSSGYLGESELAAIRRTMEDSI